MAMAQKNYKKTKNSHNSTVKTAVMAVICTALIALGTVGILVLINNKGGSEPHEEKQTRSESEKNETKVEETKNEEDDEEKWSKSQQDKDGNPNKLANLTGTISFAGISDGNFVIRVMIDQTLGSSSTCEFTMTHDSGTVVNGRSAVESGPSASYCFYSAPAKNFKSGHYEINVKMTSPDKEGEVEGEAKI